MKNEEKCIGNIRKNANKLQKNEHVMPHYAQKHL